MLPNQESPSENVEPSSPTVPRIYRSIAWSVISASFAYIIVVLILSYLVDIRQMDVFGLRTHIENIGWHTVPLLWVHVFTEASWTEHVQWFLIRKSLFVATYCWIVRLKATGKLPRVWTWLVTGLYIMFLEDTINFRHRAVAAIRQAYVQSDAAAMIWATRWPRTIIECSIYSILGTIMIIALIGILKNPRLSLPGKQMLLAGYIFYGVAAVGSATRNVGNWYIIVGGKLLDALIQSADVSWTADCVVWFGRPLGFWFMDFIVEESLELLGAAFLLGALIMFTASVRNQNK